MQTLDNWSTIGDSWLYEDLALLRGDSGWHSLVARDNLHIEGRAMPDDPNHLFRWRLAVKRPLMSCLRAS